MSTAEQRALDRHMGQLAEVVADTRDAVTHSLGHAVGTLRTLGMAIPGATRWRAPREDGRGAGRALSAFQRRLLGLGGG